RLLKESCDPVAADEKHAQAIRTQGDIDRALAPHRALPVAPQFIQWPDSELEALGFFAYPLVALSHPMDHTRTWRSAGCLTSGPRILIPPSGNSTSLTGPVRTAVA